MLRRERRQLHGRAAWALEAMSEGRLEEVAAVLGHHFAAADQAERAVHYLEMAGDHALRSFANDEAITSFHAALAIADQERPGSAAMARTALLLRRKLAQVLWRIGQRGQARQMVQDAIGLAGPNEDFQRARIQILLGQMELDEQRYPEAAAAYDSAEELLGERPWDGNEATVAQWLDVMVVGRLLYLQRKEPGLALAVLDAARPVLELKGSESYRDQFHRHLAWQQALQHGWLIDEEVIANARTAAAAASAAGDDSSWYEKGPSIAWAALWLGFFLMLHGELEEAQDHLQTSQVMAERSGDVVLRAAALFCLVLNALRNHDVAAVRSLAPKVVVAGEVAGYAEMVTRPKAASRGLPGRTSARKTCSRSPTRPQNYGEAPVGHSPFGSGYTFGLLSLFTWTAGRSR